ncbi:hypothetical protein Q3G72_012042 [Acer saccharum]|nr:hypothetical protein Q3G72_012042 [Acer saccharum]
MEVGRVLGEPLIVEQNTLARRNLVMGRMLVLMPLRKCYPEVIKVVNSRMSVSLEVEMDTVPVTVSWVEKVLALRKAKGSKRTKKGRRFFKGKEAVLVRTGGMRAIVSEERIILIGKGVISISQKGKGKMEYVKKKPAVRYDPNAKLVLEKRKIYNQKGGFKEGFRTPSLDFEGVGISEFGKGKGESSHQKMGGLGGPKSNIIVDFGLISLLNGLKSSNLHLGQSSELSSGDKSGRKATTKLDSNHRGA